MEYENLLASEELSAEEQLEVVGGKSTCNKGSKPPKESKGKKSKCSTGPSEMTPEQLASLNASVQGLASMMSGLSSSLSGMMGSFSSIGESVSNGLKNRKDK